MKKYKYIAVEKVDENGRVVGFYHKATIYVVAGLAGYGLGTLIKQGCGLAAEVIKNVK